MNNTVCVWDGIVEATQTPQGNVDLEWYGCWVANANSSDASTVPEIKRNAFSEFCDSDLLFRVKGTAAPVNGSVSPNHDRFMFQPFRAQVAGGEGYDWQGTKHHDDQHEILFERLRWSGSSDKRTSLIYARGRNEYGAFVSVGWMRPGNRVTLARRYVGTDGRDSWTVEKVRDAVLKAIFNEEDDTIIMPPWQCDVLNAKYQ